MLDNRAHVGRQTPPLIAVRLPVLGKPGAKAGYPAAMRIASIYRDGEGISASGVGLQSGRGSSTATFRARPSQLHLQTKAPVNSKL
jgi:hypothetical protein